MKTFRWDLLPEIRYLGISIKFDDEVQSFFDQATSLSDTAERAQAAQMFFAQAVKQSDGWRMAAFLRAGLSEFVSMDDAFRADWRRLRPGARGPNVLRETSNPLVYLMYILRNINIHARCSKVIHDKSKVQLSDPDNPVEFDLDVDILESTVRDQLLVNRGTLKFCNKYDLERIYDWIDQKQFIFGAGHVFSKGLNAYYREIIQWYNKMLNATADAVH